MNVDVTVIRSPSEITKPLAKRQDGDVWKEQHVRRDARSHFKDQRSLENKLQGLLCSSTNMKKNFTEFFTSVRLQINKNVV